MTTSVFQFDNYKTFLTEFIADTGKGTMTRLAEAAGCQRSYLSDVLRREVQLTPDHADAIARYLGMTAPEVDFFHDLVSLARAASKPYRERLRARIKATQRTHARLTTRLAPATPEKLVSNHRYYASWHHAAIHIATAIPHLNTIKSLARRLMLPEAVVEASLQELVEDGFVFKDRDRYHYNIERLVMHLPDDSIFSRLNHSNWRNLTLSRAPQYDTEVHYSLVFAIDRKDYDKVRDQILELIQAQRRTIAASGSEEIAYFGCDLFVL